MTKQRAILYIQTYNEKLQIKVVSQLLPVLPTSVWQKGDPMIVNGIEKKRPWSSSNWSFEQPEIEINNVIDGLKPLLDFFVPYKEELINLRELGFTTYVCLVIHIDSEKLPDFSLDYKTINTLSELGLSLSYDIYRI